MVARRSFPRSLQIAFLSALAGCLAATIILYGSILAVGQDGLGIDVILVALTLGSVAGAMGILFSIPAALILGTPLIWLLGDRMAASPKTFGILLAVMGAACGWIVFQIGFSGGPESLADMPKYSCIIFGTIVAGAMPFVTSWLEKRENVEAGALTSRSS